MVTSCYSIIFVNLIYAKSSESVKSVNEFTIIIFFLCVLMCSFSLNSVPLWFICTGSLAKKSRTRGVKIEMLKLPTVVDFAVGKSSSSNYSHWFSEPEMIFISCKCFLSHIHVVVGGWTFL